MQWFGESWGAPFNESSPRVDTPVGVVCNGWCEEPIEATDTGVVMGGIDADGQAELVYFHRNCYLRSVYGSVGHQLGLCVCFRKPGPDTFDDPPGLSAREAADQAVELFERQGFIHRPLRGLGDQD